MNIKYVMYYFIDDDEFAEKSIKIDFYDSFFIYSIIQ